MLNLQPLSINTISLAVAENMADLIDGYCRLGSGKDTSLIVRPKRGEWESHYFMVDLSAVESEQAVILSQIS